MTPPLALLCLFAFVGALSLILWIVCSAEAANDETADPPIGDVIEPPKDWRWP